MIDPAAYCRVLRDAGISYFVGVPDSLLRDFNECLSDLGGEVPQLTTACEGGALAYAAGRYMATGGFGMVYLQNSGFGNLINPLLSLTDPEVYAIPALLLIGWRGQPGTTDEPQHVKQGRVQEALLEAAEIDYAIHPDSIEDAEVAIAEAVDSMRTRSAPFALLVPKGTFASYRSAAGGQSEFEMRREDALSVILESLDKRAAVVSTTGKTSREVFELREAKGQGHDQDFLTVGSMGHASQIALGIAHATPGRDVYCVDGDGAFLMHMGAVPVSGVLGLSNFKHIVINNGAHESVGGQPTVALDIDLPAIAIASGYAGARSVSSPDALGDALAWLRESAGPLLLEIKVAQGSRADLGRPTQSPQQNLAGFMERLSDGRDDL